MTKTPNQTQSAAKCPVSLEDVDLFAPGAQEHWYEAYSILHDQAPVLRLPGEGLTPDADAFVLTKYEDVAMVVKDLERFPGTMNMLVSDIRSGAVTPEALQDVDVMIQSMASLRYTPELWRAHRKDITDPWVGPGAGRHKDMIAQHAQSLIDGWIDSDEIDFVAAFARPLPQRVLAAVLGFPLEDIPQLAQWGEAQVMPYVHGAGHRGTLTPEQSAQKLEKLNGFKAYVETIVAQKRRSPEDDMISFLTQMSYDAMGRKLSDLEINGIVYAMVIGGLETTQYALEEQAQLLCETPGLFQTLKADRSLIRHFTEEAMRLRAPTQGLSTRVTSQDEVFQGVNVPKGSLLHLRFAAANVDADAFDCPRDLQMDRKGAGRHLTFSAGTRICPGAGISRAEQVTAWNCIFDRLERIDYAPGNDFKHQPGMMLGTLKVNLKITKA